MGDSLKKTKDELERFIAAISQLAPTVKFGNISLAELEADDATMHDKDMTVEQNRATLVASQDDRQLFAQTVGKELELVKNGVIGDPNFGPDSPLYGAMGFVRTSERASGLTHKKKDEPDDK